MTPPPKPRLRPLEIIPLEHEGEEVLLLRDRSGLAADAVVPRALGPLLSLFDGTRAVADIVAVYERRSGELLAEELVLRIVQQIDEALLLASPRFEAHRHAVVGSFELAPTREAAFAGASYPKQPAALRARLAGYFAQAKQLGAPAACYAPEKLRGIVVPHIDFTRGGPVEALAYERLGAAEFDVCVVLGIAHCGVRYPFCAAPKDYATPLGTCRADIEFVEALQELIGPRLTAEQFAHKSEHSVEFVAVFLQAMEQFRATRIVPILCGGFHDAVRSRTEPASDADIAEFCAALGDTVRAYEARGLRVGLIASVDLAHIGSRFGDDTPLTPEYLDCIEHEDRAFLAAIESGSATAMHAHIARDDNSRNIDAHPAVYTLLHAFPELRAQLLHYAQAYDAAANSVVSFASMALYET